MFGLNSAIDNQENVNKIAIDKIQANPFQPRKFFDPIQIEELSKSIKEYGVIQPIIVRKLDDNYELVAGERRLRASKSIGLKEIPAIVRNFDNKEMAEIALIENLQREDLNYFEEAEGYKKLIDEFNLTQEEVAKRVGKSQSTIANKIRILRLPDEVKNLINTDLITERHARALLKLGDEQSQQEALKEIYENELNVRETDLLIDEYINRKNDKEKPKGNRIVRIFKDMRIYINTIKTAVKTIEEAGIKVNMEERDLNDHVEVVIKIPKIKK